MKNAMSLLLIGFIGLVGTSAGQVQPATIPMRACNRQ
jgi:hypothetical protein